jgi:hypothetical protein
MGNSVIPRVRIWEGLDGLCASVLRPSSGFFGACNPFRDLAITFGWKLRQQEQKPAASDRGPRSFVDFAVDDRKPAGFCGHTKGESIENAWIRPIEHVVVFAGSGVQERWKDA